MLKEVSFPLLTDCATPLETPIAPHWRQVERKVRVVLPAFNESANLGALLESIDQVMLEDHQAYQIHLVDDGSKDNTVEVARAYQKILPLEIHVHEKNQGLGATIRDGLVYATQASQNEDIIIAMDADNTHTPGLMRSMIRSIREGSEVVIASRYQKDSRTIGVPFYRNVLSFFASIVFQIAFPTKGVRDFTCGYRAYRANVLKRAIETYGKNFVEQDGFEAMVEILLKLRAMKVLFREVPLVLRYDYKAGASKMNVLKTIRKSLGVVIRRRLSLWKNN